MKWLSGGATGTVILSVGSTTGVQARGEYTPANNKYTDEPIDDLSIDYASNPKIGMDSKNNRIAFATNLFTDSIELYLAADVESADEVPTKIYQITSNSDIGVMDLNWRNQNNIEFWKDGSVYTINIQSLLNPNRVGKNDLTEKEKIKTRKIPNTVKNRGGV